MNYTTHGILQAKILEWVAVPFSRGSSQPRNRTQVSCVAGRFFTNWAIREAPLCSDSCPFGQWPSNHLILCLLFLLLPSVFPSIQIFSSESAFRIRWPKYWSVSIHPSSEYAGWFPLRLIGLISLLSKGLLSIFCSTTIWKHQFFSTQPSLWSNSYILTWQLEKPYAV